MSVGMYDVVVKTFTFAISSTDEFLSDIDPVVKVYIWGPGTLKKFGALLSAEEAF